MTIESQDPDKEGTKHSAATGLVGIEYAHIYSDQQFSRQHELGITELHKLSVGPHIKKIVLVDDYSPPHRNALICTIFCKSYLKIMQTRM